MIYQPHTKNLCYNEKNTHVPRGFMLHSTGVNNPYLRRYCEDDKDGLIGVNLYDNHWNRPTPDGRRVCVHGFIGLLSDNKTVEFVQTLPWEMRGWHSGVGSKGSANQLGYVGVEICEDSLDDAVYFKKAYDKAVEVVSQFCSMYKLNPLAKGVVICHSEGYKMGIATDHSDVMHWFPKHGKSMDTFRSDVANAMCSEGHEWSKKEREWAVNTGLFAGDGKSYRWEENITREEIAVLLYRFAHLK